MRRIALLLALAAAVAACGGDDLAPSEEPGTAVVEQSAEGVVQESADTLADVEDTEDASGTDAEPLAEVLLTAEAEISGESLIISGTATVPDGALIAYEITDSAWREGGFDEDGNPLGQWIEGNVPVESGTYSTKVNTNEMSPGEIEIWLAFQTILSGAEQPPEIVELYGSMGESITGPDVIETGGMKRVETTVTVTK